MNYTLNCNGRLLSLEEPQVMGILNVTPDSFYAGSRVQTERDIVSRAQQIVTEGGSMIDVGACSTRPDSEPATEQEEMERLLEDAQKISFATSEDEKSWTFSGIKEASKKQLKFEGANVSVTIKSDDEIVLQYTENGKPKNVVFVSFDSDITKIIEAERNRRQNALEKIAKVGPRFSSENYGTLIISSGEGEKYNFYWDNFKLLQPSIIPSSANTRGTVSIDYLIPDSMKANYDGLLTFDFGSEYEVNFLYKLTDSGLRLEDAVRGKIEGGILKAKSSSPTVIFLEK